MSFQLFLTILFAIATDIVQTEHHRRLDKVRAMPFWKTSKGDDFPMQVESDRFPMRMRGDEFPARMLSRMQELDRLRATQNDNSWRMRGDESHQKKFRDEPLSRLRGDVPGNRPRAGR